MYKMSNLKKIKDSYQVLEKNPRLCFIRKRSSRTYKKCLNKMFWPNILTVNTLCANVCKIYECDKNRMLYYNVKSFKNSNF